jgi:hypothetical protein
MTAVMKIRPDPISVAIEVHMAIGGTASLKKS